MKLLLTVPAYADFTELAAEPVIEGIRLNTSIPLNDSLEEVIKNVKEKAGAKDVWIDLKGRQPRIEDYGIKILKDEEVHFFKLSHKLKVNLPADIYLDDGNFSGKIKSIQNDDTLIVVSSVEKNQGLPLAVPGSVGIRPGMSVNIPDPSLEIDGYLTQRDKEYIEAAKKNDIHKYFTSYVEKESDITDILNEDNEAFIGAKIESKKGLEFVKDIYPKYKDKVVLMAARGDLYMEIDMPHQIIGALKQIISADKEAIAASRIFNSLKNIEEMPSCNDITDLAYLIELGYKRFLLGDDVCLKKDSVKAAIGLFKAILGEYKK